MKLQTRKSANEAVDGPTFQGPRRDSAEPAPVFDSGSPNRPRWSGLVLFFALVSSILCVPVAGVSAQNTNDRVATSTANSDVVRQWRERQQQVIAANGKVMPAVVSITDGESFGSGVVVSKDGLILTAGHVIIESDREFEVMFPDGRTAAAKALGKNLNADAGMMKLTDPDRKEWPYVEVGSTEAIRLGQWVIALGHAGGYDLGRTPPLRLGRVLRKEQEALTTDCAIIGGDSGGPLFDLDGKLIGIHSSIGDSIAENRHVSVDMFLKDWDRLESGESWGRLPGTEPPPQRDSQNRNSEKEDRRGDGKRSEDSSDDDSSSPQGSSEMSNQGTAALGVEVSRSDRQAVIRGIKPNSAAARVGLREGDIILSLDDVPIKSPQQLVERIGKRRVGEVVKAVIQRNGQRLEYQIILGEL